MKKTLIVLAASVLGCAACSPGGGLTAEAATVEECREMLQKGLDMAEHIPPGALDELVDVGAARCGEGGPATKEHYRCAMKATNSEEFGACKIPV